MEHRSPESEWLTNAEAAQLLRVHPVTLARWARERKVPAHPLSGVARKCWRYKREELNAMLAASSAGPN